MADDPTRYLDVSGVLALKAGATVDVDYTVTHANSVAARLGEVAESARLVAAESEARDDTLYGQIQDVRAVAEAGGGGMPDGGQPGQVLTTGSDGSAAWADPTGMPGRGITSIVASTTDPTTATVTYTDGSTAALTLPQGAAGRSISSFGAPDGEGVSVVTFSDGSTTTITLPKGPQGDPGPAPTVSWSGDVLTVDGKASPPLTGPASTTPGPAPSIKIGTVTSGTTPSATITGTSPDLTLDLVLAKGDKGDPGAAQDARIITGPGRPDAPTTTGGLITGAEPVGAEYRSTDGASVGAFVWMKRPGGKWEVESGDTGWRLIHAAPERQAVAGLSTFGGNEPRIRRVGVHVYFAWFMAFGATSGQVRIFNPFAGFGHTGAPILQPLVLEQDGALVGTLGVYTSGLWVSRARTGNVPAALSWPTAAAWPTTLPGTPA